jgi:hypothetical protein
MCHLTVTFVCIGACLAQAPAAFAQHITVQQPSLETFGVATTVSVPDRGRTSLGGVSRARASRSTYGFGPFRTNMGLSSQTSGAGVGVRIHDLDEMDRQVLNAADRGRRTRNDFSMSPAAQRAYATLRERSTERDVVIGAGNAIVTTGRQAPLSPSMQAAAGPPAEKLLDRARQAESAGKRGLALAYLRASRDAGSVEAGKEIVRLSKKK